MKKYIPMALIALGAIAIVERNRTLKRLIIG